MSNDVTYEGTGALELWRAIGVWLTVVGTVLLLLMGRQLIEWEDPAPALVSLAIFVAGLSLLLWSRARLRAVWERNKPYLLSEKGVNVTRGRRDAAKTLARISHVLLALFVLVGLIFFGFFSAASCGERIVGFCGDVGRPPEDLVTTLQMVTLVIGAAWAGVMTMRNRQDDQTERIDIVVADGQRMRRQSDPLLGSDRFSWE